MGAAQYGADVRLPGMKYAVIARPPVTGGKVVSFDGAAAMKVSGVEKVMEVKGWPWPSKFQPLGGVAVIARNTGAAIKGRDALKIVWDDGANGKYKSVAYRAQLEEAARKPGLVVRKEGDVEAALKGADKVIVGEYYLPHLAHVAMEPPVAVADVKGDKAEIWAPVQSAGGTREDVAKTLGIPQEKSPSTSPCSAAASGASRNAISRSKRRCFQRSSAPPSRCNGRGKTTFAMASSIPSRWSASRPASTRAAR